MSKVPWAKPKTWEEVFAITGGVVGVSIDQINHGEPVDDYHLSSKDLKPCSRDACGALHCNGWIVRLADGRHTNIGKDCAKKYANAEFNARVREFETAERQRQAAEAIRSIKVECQQLQAWLVATAVERDAAAALQQGLAKALDGPVYSELDRRAERNQPEIRRARTLTKDERELRKAMQEGAIGNDRPGFVPAEVEETIGSLRGLRSIGTRMDIRYNAMNLARQLEWLLRAEPESREKRTEFNSRWDNANTLKRKLDASIEAVHQMVEPSNLSLIQQLPVCKGQGIRGIRRLGDRIVVDRVRRLS